MTDIKLKLLTLGAMSTNGYVIYSESRAVVIDPGDDFFKIQQFLKEQDLKLEGILLTHGHFDHIGAVEALRNAYKVKVYALEQEQDTLKDPAKNLSASMNSGYGIEADVWLRDGEKLSLADIDFQVIHTPGHTVGGVCYYVKETNMLFSGDTLFHGSVGRSDFPGGSAGTLIRTIKEKLLCLPEDTKVFPGHMESSTISIEKQYNPFLQGVQ